MNFSRNKKSLGLLGGILILLSTSGQAEPKIQWTSFKSNILQLTVSVPSDWKPVKAPNALAFRYEGIDGTKAGLGILKSNQTEGIDALADAEFQKADPSSGWVKVPARIDDKRAIKIVGVDINNKSMKFVHYYIETPQGTYLAQCQAPQDQWGHFSDLFAGILMHLKFFPQ